jgi:hypothetical protein
MTVVFFVDPQQDSGYLSMSTPVACHLLTALGYDLENVARMDCLAPADLLPRIAAVRRQLALGRGSEFTADGLDEPQMLGHLVELEKVVSRAYLGGKNVVVL